MTTTAILRSALLLTAFTAVGCDVGVVHRTADGGIYSRGVEKRHVAYGRWMKLAADGSRDTVFMTKGSLDGIWKQFFPDGRVKSSIILPAGTSEGPSTVWHPNGQVALQGAFRVGKRHGPWLFWNPNGELNQALSGYYQHGVKIGGS